LGGIGTGAFDVLAPVKIRDPLKDVAEEVNDVVLNDVREKRDSDSESEEEEEDEDEDEDVDGDVQMNDVEMEDVDGAAEEVEDVVQEIPKKKEKKSKKHRRDSD
jgi:DNA-directed RNA polymerase I subunit RPA1